MTPSPDTRCRVRGITRAPTRAYAMKAVEDKDALNVIVSNFHIFETIVLALIDPVSTHFYVYNSIPSLGSLPKNEIKYDILVTNLLRHNIIVNRVYRDCLIRIREYEFSRLNRVIIQRVQCDIRDGLVILTPSGS